MVEKKDRESFHDCPDLSSGMTAYTYDGNDNLTKRRTPKGDDILFAYDKGGREYLFDGWIAFKTPDPFFPPTPFSHRQ